MLLAATLLSLAAFGMVLVLLSRSRAAKSASIRGPEPPVSKADLKRVDSQVQLARNEAGTALTQAARVDEAVRQLDTRLSAALSKVVSEVRSAAELARQAQRDDTARQLDQVRAELSGITDAVAEVSGISARAQDGGPDLRTAEGAAAAVAASVNQWLRSGASGRRSLLEHMRALNFPQASLATLEGGQSSSGGFEYTFSRSEDGPWLWLPVPGSNDAWAAPADAQFMGMGAVPMQLSQLMAGMENAGQGFRFASIYRPCRLRPVAGQPNAYTLGERGALQLEGTPAPPGPPPPAFDRLRQGAESIRSGGVRGSSVGRALAEWIRTSTRQMEDYARDLGQLQEEFARPRPIPATPPSADLARLGREVAEARRESERAAAESRRLGDQIRALELALSASRRPEAASDSVPAPIRAETAVQPQASALPSRPPRSEATSTSLASPVAPAPAIPPAVAAASAPTASTSPQELASTATAPDEASPWLQVFLIASQRPEAGPEVEGLPSPELYGARLNAVVATLLDLYPGAPVRLMHLVRPSPAGSTIELHETETSESRILCRVCKVPHLWQIVICTGGAADERLHLLLPVGALAKSNYSSGFSALIEDVPSGTFVVTPSEEPAVLQRMGEGGNAYTITRKLLLNSTAPSPSGKA